MGMYLPRKTGRQAWMRLGVLVVLWDHYLIVLSLGGLPVQTRYFFSFVCKDIVFFLFCLHHRTVDSFGCLPLAVGFADARHDVAWHGMAMGVRQAQVVDKVDRRYGTRIGT
ncbi:hypothetical protein B0H66DRAFT_158264 [Apodospora peruviana]|uniref:Uncharacterized protein n=1 Tax=Apodospora peruviana TaxID=516989 RepID=A0AAE0IJV9_9PEZI|nr:hypothetical protein B0H66DRAFT_158264 [Apodospora peruviana]